MAPKHFLAKRERFEGWDKYNRDYWLANYPDFAEHFIRNICSEPHSTKQIEDGIEWARRDHRPGAGQDRGGAGDRRRTFDVGEAMYRKIRCPAADDPRRQRPDPALCARGRPWPSSPAPSS